MALIDDTLNFLGLPYCIRNIDLEPVIYRSMVQYEFEISRLHGNTVNCALYVWRKSPRELVGIYSNIKTKEDLKDLLGYCSVKYQNLFSRIRVEREGQTE